MLINSGGVTTIRTIDLSNITVSDKVSIGSIQNPVQLKGKELVDCTLQLDGSNVTVQGFTQVKNFIYTYYNAAVASPDLFLPLRKVTGDLMIGFVSYDKLSLPNLEEVAGNFILQLYTPMSLDLPVLKKSGKMNLELASTGMNKLTIPQLSSVEGDLTIVTGNFDGSIGGIDLPALTKINGMLNIGSIGSYAPNTRLTDLNGFSALTNVQGVAVHDNIALTDFTGLKNALPSFTAGKWSIAGNAHDPSYQDMVDGKYVKP